MDYYKIIQNGEIVGVGTRYLRWFLRSKGYYYCGLNLAEAVEDDVSGTMFHPMWMHESPSEAYVLPVATVEEIDYTEYDELYNQLDDGETIPVPDPEPEPQPEPSPEPEPDPERPMTVQEMRNKIAELTALVMTANEDFPADKTYQIDDLIAHGSRVYIASQVIIVGETVRPGFNCTETTIAEVLNLLQTQA